MSEERDRTDLPPRTRMGRVLRVPSAPTAALLVVLVVAGAWYVVLARRLWFFGDDWDFLVLRRIGSAHDLLAPHSEHWVTTPLVMFRVLYAVFGLHHYLPYALLPIVVHLAIVVLMYTTLRAHHVRAWQASGVATFLAFLACSGENVLWDFQVGFLTPMALALVALLVLRRGVDWPHRSAVWVVLLLALASTGTGLAALTWVAGYALLTDGVRRAVLDVSLPVVGYATWYLTFGRTESVPHQHVDALLLLEAFGRGLAAPWDRVLVVPGSGALVIVACVLGVWLLRPPARLRALAVSGLFAMVPFYGLIAFSRVGLAGVQAGDADRYSYIGVVLTLPAVAVLVRAAAERLRGTSPVVARVVAPVVLVVLVVTGVVQVRHYQVERVGVVAPVKGIVLAAADLVETDAPLLSTLPDPIYTPNLSVAQLRDPDVRDALPRDRTSPRNRVDAEAGLQVASALEQLPVPVASDARLYDRSNAVAGSDPAPRAIGPSVCLSGSIAGDRGVIIVRTGAGGGQVLVDLDADRVNTVLVDGGRKSRVIQRIVVPGTPTWVGTSVSHARLRIGFGRGPYTICTRTAPS